MFWLICYFGRKLLENQIALTDSERSQLKKEFDKATSGGKTQESFRSGNTASGSVVLTELYCQRTAAEQSNRKKVLQLEALAKKHDVEIKVRELITYT